MNQNQIDMKLHGVLAGLTEAEFAEWNKKATRTMVLRNVTDEDLLAKVAAVVEPADLAEFDQPNILQYAQQYEAGNNVVKMVLMTARHIYNRLDQRDKGEPMADDPIGRALAETGRTRRGP